MAYRDGNSGNGRKVLTGGAVALIQGGLALALANGFAVAFFTQDPPEHLQTRLFPTAPVSPVPIDPPPARADPVPTSQSRIVAPERAIELTPEAPITVPIGPVAPSGGLAIGDPQIIPTIAPSEPAARFASKSAKPKGNVAGWVTTSDYPTADIRAGHTGTVRFRLGIDAAGRVADCTVIQSSGFPGLDTATCRNVSRRARFDAANDVTGGKVAGTYDGTIRWVIPQD